MALGMDYGQFVDILKLRGIEYFFKTRVDVMKH